MEDKVTDIRCTLCGRLVFHNYLLRNTQAEDSLASRWFFCACGCLFNLFTPDKAKLFSEDYRKEMLDIKEAELRYDWYVRNYAVIAEEKTYGRKFLDVGYGVDFVVKNMRKRGWLATGIDLIPGSIITGDFETYGFGKQTFDFIWLANVLECFDDPMKALRKAYNLLNPCGLIFIVTPNTDLFRNGKIADWKHWDIERNRRFFSEWLLRQMIYKVEPTMKGGLKVLYADDTLSDRFISPNVIHMLCQKWGVEE